MVNQDWFLTIQALIEICVHEVIKHKITKIDNGSNTLVIKGGFLTWKNWLTLEGKKTPTKGATTLCKV